MNLSSGNFLNLEKVIYYFFELYQNSALKNNCKNFFKVKAIKQFINKAYPLGKIVGYQTEILIR